MQKNVCFNQEQHAVDVNLTHNSGASMSAFFSKCLDAVQQPSVYLLSVSLDMSHQKEASQCYLPFLSAHKHSKVICHCQSVL